MTKVVFLRHDGVYYGFREEGHAGAVYESDSGSEYDVLCAAISAMTMLIVNTIEVSLAANIEYTSDEVGTVITVKCLSALPKYEKDEKKRYAIKALFEGYYYQLNDLMVDYCDYLDVDVQDTEEI